MADWKIRRRHGECSRCQSEFVDGDRHASLLRVDEEQDLVREDLCPTCFREGESDSYVFWWFTKFQEKRSSSVQFDLGSLERLFMELEGREEAKLRELRYLLCLLLMRKRKLKLQKVKRGKHGEELILRRPRRQEELSVFVFDFTPDRMEELRSRLQEVLEGSGPDSEEGSEGTEGPHHESAAEHDDEFDGEGELEQELNAEIDSESESESESETQAVQEQEEDSEAALPLSEPKG